MKTKYITYSVIFSTFIFLNTFNALAIAGQSEFFIPKSSLSPQKKEPLIKPKQQTSSPAPKISNYFAKSTKTNLIFRNIPLADVLKFIAEEGNKKIVCDKSVTGTVNLNLQNITLNQAMNKILKDYNLTAVLTDNTIYIKKNMVNQLKKTVNITNVTNSSNNIKTVASISLPIKSDNTKSITQNSQIKPKIEQNLSLSLYIKSYSSPYEKTFGSTLKALSAAKVEIIAIDSKVGTINGRISGWKGLYIVVKQNSSNNTSVKISPIDGIYNIPTAQVKEIFTGIDNELLK